MIRGRQMNGAHSSAIIPIASDSDFTCLKQGGSTLSSSSHTAIYGGHLQRLLLAARSSDVRLVFPLLIGSLLLANHQ
jgi:hypothetical protein